LRGPISSDLSPRPASCSVGFFVPCRYGSTGVAFEVGGVGGYSFVQVLPELKGSVAPKWPGLLLERKPVRHLQRLKRPRPHAE
jgi:hypothetical protein